MALYFITGNKNKFNEVKTIIPNIEQLEIDLPEIQSINAEEIIKAKLKEAFKHKQAEFIVEDTSLYLDELNGLPGPLIKWFLDKLGNEGIANLIKNTGKAQAKTMIGYAKDPDNIHFFEGVVPGEIVQPRGKTTFGWDTIFQPDTHEQTFAEMGQEEKNKISMRKLAAEKLKNYLNQSV